MPYIIIEDISTAYRESLDKVVNAPRHHLFCLTTAISKPILENIDEEVDVIESKVKIGKNEYKLKRYKLEGLNIDKKIHLNFKKFLLYIDKNGKEWFGKDKIAIEFMH